MVKSKTRKPPPPPAMWSGSSSTFSVFALSSASLAVAAAVYCAVQDGGGGTTVVKTVAHYDSQKSPHALHTAARLGSLGDLRALLEAGEDVNQKMASRGRASPLHMAAFAGQVAAAQFLLEHGANVSSEDATGATPLHLASAKGSSIDMVRILLERGASIDVEDVRGRWPPLIASQQGQDKLRAFMLDGESSTAVRDSCWAQALRGGCERVTGCEKVCLQQAAHLCRNELRADLIGERHISSLFFDTATERSLPLLTFLTNLTPRTSDELLSTHGLEAVERFDDAGDMRIQAPHITHTTSAGRAIPLRCKHPTAPSEVRVGGSDLLLLRTHNATATFDGLVYTANGAVLSPSPTMTKQLQREMVISGLRSGIYRPSRSCPSADGVRAACCVVAGSEAASQLTLWPLLLGLVNHAKADTDSLLFDSFFGDACGSSEALQSCTGLSLEPAAVGSPKVVSMDSASLLVWQPRFSDNFGHFLAEALPRLMRLAPWIEAHSDCLLFFAGNRPFSRTILMDVFGWRSRLVPFDPCTIYRASTIYVAVGTGRQMALAPDYAHESDLALPTRAQANDMRSAMLRLVPPPRAASRASKPYVLFVDRSDAPTRANPSTHAVGALRRADLTNMAEAFGAVEAALARHGVELRRFRAGGMSLAAQVKSLAEATGLIGTHAAGITSVFMLPDEAFLVEITPARKPFENWMASEEMSSQCGYGMFWYLAEARGLRYHALLLHDHTFEDVLTVPANELAGVVEDMVVWRERPGTSS